MILIISYCLFFYSTEAFSADRGARDGATKVMIVVTDGESHDGEELPGALEECEKRNITRYAIAVSKRPTVSAQFHINSLQKIATSMGHQQPTGGAGARRGVVYNIYSSNKNH